MAEIKLLGIDPSLNNLGLAFGRVNLDSFDVSIDKLVLEHPDKADKVTKKTVRKNSDDLRRARCLHKALQQALKEAQIAIVEVPVGSQSARAMASYGICIGVLASCNIPMIEVTPSEVKLVSVGSKTASKAEMIEWAMTMYPDANWKMTKRGGVMVPTNANEHLADAVAAIHAGLLTDQFATSASMMRSMMAA